MYVWMCVCLLIQPLAAKVQRNLYQRVCMSVCLSARVSQKPLGQISPNFLHMLPVPLLDPRLTVIRYVMYFRFCGRRHVFI